MEVKMIFKGQFSYMCFFQKDGKTICKKVKSTYGAVEVCLMIKILLCTIIHYFSLIYLFIYYLPCALNNARFHLSFLAPGAFLGACF